MELSAPAARGCASLLLQVRYTGRWIQGESKPVESGATLPAARIGLEGNLRHSNLGTRLELDLGEGRATPLDLYLQASAGQFVAFRAGQQRVPFGRSWLMDEAVQSFVERSLATEEFRYDRDIGALGLVSVFDQRLQGWLGIFNGAGPNTLSNDNIDPLLAARLFVTPIGPPRPAWSGDRDEHGEPVLGVGVSATLDYAPVPVAYGYTSGTPLDPLLIVDRDIDADGRVDGVRVAELEGDLGFSWAGLAVQAEGYYRNESWGSLGTDQPNLADQFVPHHRFGGFSAELSYLFAQRLEFGMRTSLTELSPLTIGGKTRPKSTCLDSNGAAFECALPYSDERSELSWLLAYVHPPALRVSAQYSRLRWQSQSDAIIPEDREHRVLVQLQLAL